MRPQTALAVLRIVLAALLAAGGVRPFGLWLDEQGLPLGLAIAIAITAFEILGTPILALGRFVLPLCLAYSANLLVGIVLVHASEGWFVVGLGRNGAEYSVLLIACLLAIAFSKKRKERR